MWAVICNSCGAHRKCRVEYADIGMQIIIPKGWFARVVETEVKGKKVKVPQHACSKKCGKKL